MPQQTGPVTRQRMKRPMQQAMQVQPQNSATAVKQRRMDVLLPDRNEDADCHVIAQQKRNDGLPVIQNVQGATTQQTNRNDSTIHLTDSITLSVRQPGRFRSFAIRFWYSTEESRFSSDIFLCLMYFLCNTDYLYTFCL